MTNFSISANSWLKKESTNTMPPGVEKEIAGDTRFGWGGGTGRTPLKTLKYLKNRNETLFISKQFKIFYKFKIASSHQTAWKQKH